MFSKPRGWNLARRTPPPPDIIVYNWCFATSNPWGQRAIKKGPKVCTAQTVFFCENFTLNSCALTVPAKFHLWRPRDHVWGPPPSFELASLALSTNSWTASFSLGKGPSKIKTKGPKRLSCATGQLFKNKNVCLWREGSVQNQIFAKHNFWKSQIQVKLRDLNTSQRKIMGIYFENLILFVDTISIQKRKSFETFS